LSDGVFLYKVSYILSPVQPAQGRVPLYFVGILAIVGQAFADEIFRVFQNRHPEIEIKPLNMVEPVEFMIKKVEKPSQ